MIPVKDCLIFYRFFTTNILISLLFYFLHIFADVFFEKPKKLIFKIFFE